MAYVYVDDISEGLKWCIAAKRKLGNAVERNRSKRLLREYIYYAKDKIDKKRMFILARNEMLNIGLAELKMVLDATIKDEFNE